MDWITNPDIWISFLTLCVLEIVLGIDNLIFISILSNKLPEAQQSKARKVGLSLALITRVALLFSITWMMSLTKPLFTVLGNEISGRDIILLLGGLFLIYKSVNEIHEKFEETQAEGTDLPKASTFQAVIIQIMLMDIIFSFDSVITAVGMTDNLWVMVAAVVAAMIVMILAADGISDFVNRHPTVKVLALAFLIMIGVALLGEGLDFHIPKGYIYFSMAFAVIVEGINILTGSRVKVKKEKG
ncbi:MAG: TerC family protein [Bacteroidota bacterium]